MVRFTGPKRRQYQSKWISKNIGKISLASLWKDVMYLKSIVNVEFKIIDAAVSSAVAEAGSIQNLCLVAQGDDFNTRDGRRIKLQHIDVRCQVVQHATATNTTLRYIIFRTKNDQAAVPAVTDVLNNVDPLSHYEKSNNQHSFTVLLDRTIYLSDSSQTIKSLNFRRKLQTHVDYSGTGTTEANTGRGALYMLLIADEATNTPTVSGDVRVKFTDN